MFLTADEIQHLTGFKRPSAQVEWLRDHGYRFTVNGVGRPVVAVAEASRKLVGGATKRSEEPDWSAMHGAA